MPKQVTPDQMQKIFGRMSKVSKKKLAGGVQVIAADMLIQTKRQIIGMGAVYSGRLRDSFETKRIKPFFHVVGSNIHYGPIVHEGRGFHSSPRPFCSQRYN